MKTSWLIITCFLVLICSCKQPVVPEASESPSQPKVAGIELDEQIESESKNVGLRPELEEILKSLANGDLKILKEYLESGGDPNETFLDGKTFTCIASSIGNLEMLDILFSHNGDVTIVDERGMSPLHYASLYGRVGVIENLVKNGADVNLTEASGMTPLHCAATGKSVDTIRLLSKLGAASESKDLYGKTPLELAKMNGSPLVVDVLESMPSNQ